MTFQNSDAVYIIPTGDTDIDKFLGEPMVVTQVIPTNDGGYRYTRYEIANEQGDKTTVIESELRHDDTPRR